MSFGEKREQAGGTDRAQPKGKPQSGVEGIAGEKTWKLFGFGLSLHIKRCQY